MAHGVLASSDHDMDSFSNLTVEIELTENGYANHERVLATVFTYIKILVERGPQQYIFDEYRNIGKMRFDFQERGTELGHCI